MYFPLTGNTDEAPEHLPLAEPLSLPTPWELEMLEEAVEASALLR